jgi:hypothetical protein
MEKKKIEIKDSEFKGCKELWLDGKRFESFNYPDQSCLVLQRAFGLRAIHESDLKDHPEMLKAYTQYSDKEMLNDQYYTFQANKFFKAEDYGNSIVTAASSFITYGYYKKLQKAGFTVQASFLAALHHHWFTTLGMEYKKEHDEITKILNEK